MASTKSQSTESESRKVGGLNESVDSAVSVNFGPAPIITVHLATEAQREKLKWNSVLNWSAPFIPPGSADEAVVALYVLQHFPKMFPEAHVALLLGQLASLAEKVVESFVQNPALSKDDQIKTFIFVFKALHPVQRVKNLSSPRPESPSQVKQESLQETTNLTNIEGALSGLSDQQKHIRSELSDIKKTQTEFAVSITTLQGRQTVLETKVDKLDEKLSKILVDASPAKAQWLLSEKTLTIKGKNGQSDAEGVYQYHENGAQFDTYLSQDSQEQRVRVQKDWKAGIFECLLDDGKWHFVCLFCLAPLQ